MIVPVQITFYNGHPASILGVSSLSIARGLVQIDMFSGSSQLTQFIGIYLLLRIILSRIYMFFIWALPGFCPISYHSFLFLRSTQQPSQSHGSSRTCLSALGICPVRMYFFLPAKSPQPPLFLPVALLFQSLVQAISSSPVEADSILSLSSSSMMCNFCFADSDDHL